MRAGMETAVRMPAELAPLAVLTALAAASPGLWRRFASAPRLRERATGRGRVDGSSSAAAASTAICLVTRAEPEPRSPAEEAHRRRVDAALAGRAWRGRDGFGLGFGGELAGASGVAGMDPSTYGEVWELGMHTAHH